MTEDANQVWQAQVEANNATANRLVAEVFRKAQEDGSHYAEVTLPPGVYGVVIPVNSEDNPKVTLVVGRSGAGRTGTWKTS